MTVKEQIDYMTICLQIAKVEINKHNSNISCIKDNLRNVVKTANRLVNALNQVRLYEETQMNEINTVYDLKLALDKCPDDYLVDICYPDTSDSKREFLPVPKIKDVKTASVGNIGVAQIICEE